MFAVMVGGKMWGQYDLRLHTFFHLAARVGCAVVEVDLLNVVDSKPLFKRYSDQITLYEKLFAGRIIYHLPIVDTGLPPTSIINTTSTSSVASATFAISAGGDVVLNSGAYLDYEKETRYDLYIYLNDPFQNVNSDEFHLTIFIGDVNDNSPVFNQSSYTFNINENAAVNSSVGFVSASDADGSSALNNVSYSISNNMYSNVFTIDKYSGELTVSGLLDYESKVEYVLTVCATDNATDVQEESPYNEKRTSCVPVIVNIRNINEHVPMFKNSSYTIEISENSPNGLEIFRFSALDDDNTPSYYSFNASKTNASDLEKFTLNNITGVVTLNASQLDFEVQSRFTLYVYAIDSESKLSGGEAELVVNLIDINDNSPKFSSDLITLSMYENTTAGSVITTLTATDKDGISNGKLRYFILANINSDKFSVNATTGEVTLTTELDFEDRVIKFYFTLCADDSTVDTRQAETSKKWLFFVFCRIKNRNLELLLLLHSNSKCNCGRIFHSNDELIEVHINASWFLKTFKDLFKSQVTECASD